MPSQLTGRVRRRWRAYLADCFSAPEYAEHRDAIIDALSSDQPQYHFLGEYRGERAGYLVMWHVRTHAPVARVYPGEWFALI